MSISSTYNPTPDERRDLLNETALLVLARATSTDFNIRPVEIATVRRVLKEFTGQEVPEAEVRIAAKSKLFEEAPLERHLRDIARFLDMDAKLKIVDCLTEVIKSDERVSPREVNYINVVCDSMQLRISDVLKIFEDK
ncbi:MAG: TerB family tellurite resistance protein [Pseudomonadales bacterium]|nr:TerB family tellurite resistance protein [Pseudomonadales bacterium]